MLGKKCFVTRTCCNISKFFVIYNSRLFMYIFFILRIMHSVLKCCLFRNYLQCFKLFFPRCNSRTVLIFSVQWSEIFVKLELIAVYPRVLSSVALTDSTILEFSNLSLLQIWHYVSHTPSDPATCTELDNFPSNTYLLVITRTRVHDWHLLSNLDQHVIFADPQRSLEKQRLKSHPAGGEPKLEAAR